MRNTIIIGAMVIMKFGGSSLANGERMERVAGIVESQREKSEVSVVLSAMKGVTDTLIELAEMAEEGDGSWRKNLEALGKLHLDTAESLLADTVGVEKTVKEIEGLFGELEMILTGIELVKECSPRSLDLVVSFGERSSCTLFAEYLGSRGTPAEMVDARDYIVTDDGFGGASVDFPPTYANLKGYFEGAGKTPVITGFIARSRNGSTTTLGRNGSDYTASIVGAAAEAERVEIWTDVDGVLSADPRIVPTAFVIPEINFQESMELSYFGAEVIHPHTMGPAVEKDITIYIKNTLNPEAPGTKIAREIRRHDRAITGIASIPGVALINVEGSGMMGVPGIASRVFLALGKARINVIMISQASSEHSICIVIREKEARRALDALENELRPEITAKKIQNFDLMNKLEIVAVIGENMRGTPGISGRLFSALGEERVNVLAIAQGSSERNISFVIADKDKDRALNTLHRAFLGR